MLSVTIPQINERLKKLPPEKLAVVYDFVSYLMERELQTSLAERGPEPTYTTMLASETVLSRDWDRPEEDEAWADL